MITAKNYAAQAEHCLRQSAEQTPAERESLLSIAGTIQNSVHFAMPDEGIIFDDDLKGLTGHVEKFRLPFPKITLEYFTWEKDRAADSLPCPKRLIVAEEDKLDGKDVIKVVAVCYYASHRMWSPLSLGFVIEWDGNATVVRDEKGLAFGMNGTWGIVNKTHFDGVMQRFGEQAGNESLMMDFWPEMRVFLEFMEAMTCTNIKPQLMEPVNIFKQRRRAADGKLPLYETYVLTIPGEPSAKREHKQGSHASPRQHLRRGHIRRLPAGNIWVNSCVVGSASKGVIEKSYAVQI